MMKAPVLNAKVFKPLLSLNSFFPDKNLILWINIDELRERLVFSGIHRSLTTDMLQYALTRMNKGNCLMVKRKDGKTAFYRSAACLHESGAPLDQRTNLLTGYSKRLPILPETRDYLKTHPDACAKVEYINNELLQYTNNKAEYEKEQRILDKVKADKLKADKLKVSEEEARDDVNTSNNNISNNRRNATTPPPTIPFDPNVKGNNSNGIFNIPMLSEFIHNVATHAAQCQSQINLEEIDKRYGAGIIQNWQCPKCKATLQLRNCKWIRTNVVEDGRGYTRIAPDLNVRLAKGARENGINLKKLHGLVNGSLGVKTPTRNNLMHADRKVRGAVDKLYHTRQEENLTKHVTASKELAGHEQIEFEYNGIKSKASPGTVSMDGAGAKRAYRQHITGAESGVIVQSEVTGLPLSLMHSQVSNMLCMSAMYMQFTSLYPTILLLSLSFLFALAESMLQVYSHNQQTSACNNRCRWNGFCRRVQ